jgi:hypothetical protein
MFTECSLNVHPQVDFVDSFRHCQEPEEWLLQWERRWQVKPQTLNPKKCNFQTLKKKKKKI